MSFVSNYFSRTIVMASIAALGFGFISPVQTAEAAQIPNEPSTTSSPYDALITNLTITKSHDFLGDSKDVYVTVKKKSGATLPKIPDGNIYYAHLYDLTTSQYVVSEEIDSSSLADLNLVKFAGEGMHEYRVFLTHEENYSPEPPDHLDDFVWWANHKLIGASNIIEWERKDLKLTLDSDDYFFGLLGSNLTYKLNQEINGEDYAISLYNTTTGEIVEEWFQDYDSEHTYDGISFPAGDPNQFQAVLAKQDLDGYYQPPVKLDTITDIAAHSNLTTLVRLPWKVETYLDSSGDLAVDITEGGGEYGVYAADRITGKIVGYSRFGSRAYFDNKGHGDDVSWAKVYVARAFNEEESNGPQNVSELEDIIADSDGLVDDVNAFRDFSGGNNPNEYCNIGCYGDPINAATGEFFDNKVDISTTGEGLLPSVKRSFSTINKDSLNSLGYGWRTNYEMQLSSDEKASEGFGYDPDILTSRFLVIENENGSTSSFYRKDDGTFKGQSNTIASLKFNSANNTFEFERHKTKEIFTFNPSGQLIQIKDQNNKVLTLTYTNNKLTKVSDTLGNSLAFSYTTTNLISTITAQNGKKVSYTYDSAKRLTKVVDEFAVTYTYTYDSSRRMKTFTNELGAIVTQTYNTDNKVTKQVDPLGRILTFTYEGESGGIAASVTKIKHPNGRITEETYLAGNLIKKVEKVGKEARTWTYSYDGVGKLSSTIFPDSTSESSLYDGRGNLTKHIDPKQNVTSFTYDSRDNLLSSKDAFGNETVNTYDEQDNLVSTITPLGERTTFAYNAAGLLESVTDARGNASDAGPAAYSSTYSYLPNGLLTSSTDASQNQTAMTYDSFGNMVKTTNARGFETNVTYTEAGLPTTILDPFNNQTAITYDKMGNVLTSKNANNAITSYTYDSLGNMLTMTDANGGVTAYTYDAMNNPVSIMLPDGTVQNITYNGFGEVTEVKDQLGRTKKQEWDSAGNLKASIDADGGRTEYVYDRARNLISEKTPTGAVTKAEYNKLNQLVKTTDGVGRVTEIVYDANGRVVEAKNPDKTTTKNVYDQVGNIINTVDEKGGEKAYAYDAMNRKVAYTNETGQITTYAYDGMSNLVSETRPDSSMVSYEYDARDLLTRVDYAGTDNDVNYSYDAIGRKISETKGNRAPVAYVYDSLNRILSSGAEGNKVAYEYDIVGNVKKVTYPSGRIVDYGYDIASQTTSVSSSGIPSTALNYNNRGLPTSTVLPNGITEKKEYDLDGKLSSTELTNAASTSLYKKTQKYNQVGEVIQKGVSVNGINVTLDNFTYDPASRLTQQETEGTKETVNEYGYSPVGSLNTVNGKVQDYDEAGKLLSAGTAELTYDARNNRTGVTDTADSSKNVEYSWNENNTLSAVTTHKENASDVVTAYEYSADKLLASRTSGGETQKFVWDTNRTIPVMLSDGKYEYLYKGQSERVPFAQVELSTGIITYLHSDLTGSVTASTGVSGELLGTVDYSPYGEATGALLSAFGYAGEWVDNATGYTYLRMRWLDTTTGTFLSEDPLVQTTNSAFGYTEGNPITQIDPLGLFSWSDAATWAGGIAFGLLVGAVIVASGTAVAATLIAVATVFAVVSLSITLVDTAIKCYNNITSAECHWGAASTILSLVPFAKPVIKLGTFAKMSLASKIGPYDIRLNGIIGAAKIIWPVANGLGLASDLLGRGKTYLDNKIDNKKRDNKC